MISLRRLCITPMRLFVSQLAYRVSQYKPGSCRL